MVSVFTVELTFLKAEVAKTGGYSHNRAALFNVPSSQGKDKVPIIYKCLICIYIIGKPGQEYALISEESTMPLFIAVGLILVDVRRTKYYKGLLQKKNRLK